MATFDEIRAEVLEPMRSLYRVPFGIDKPEDALAQYTRILIRYSRATLSTGWPKVLARHKKPEWPPIPTLMEIMDDVEREERAIANVRMGTPSKTGAELLEEARIAHRARQRAEELKWAVWRLRNGHELSTQHCFAQDVINEAHQIIGAEQAAGA